MDEQYNTPHQEHAHQSPGGTPGMGPGMGPTGMPVLQSNYAPEHLNKLFMWWWILLVAGIVTFIIFIGYFAIIASNVISIILMYKFWNQIQDGYQKTTPGKAVGFMFIPFFNIYWQFVAIHGFAQNANAYADRHGVQITRLNEGLALTQCILTCCCVIPLLNILAILALIPIGLINFISFKKASVAIAAHKQSHANVSAAPA